MPGFYRQGEYDLAGFSVGIVENKKAIDGSGIRPGDVLIGLKSSGFHSNGYSLIRAALKGGLLKKHARELLTPTRIYVKDINKLRAALKKEGRDILGLAHITGSGIAGNLERVLPKKVNAMVDRGSWRVPAIMRLVQKAGSIPEHEMWDAFNMGIGMIAAVRADAARTALKTLRNAVVIGRVVKGTGKVVIG
jgi:phosphoribosylformylglycinamidine cyclo-ligase